MGDFMKNALIKQESKAFIKGKRVKALSIILFLLIFCIVMTAVDFGIIFIADILRHLGGAATIALSAALVLISFSVLLVYSSVSVGEKAWYGGITSNKRNFSKRFFFWLKPKNSLRAFRFKALLFLLKSMWAVVFFLPSAILAWSVYYLSGTGGLELYLFISLSVGTFLLTTSGALFYFIAMQKYFIAEYLFSSNPKLGALTAIKQSKNLLDGHIYEIVRFKLSFLPWFFSCIFIFPVFYFLPYYKESCCVVAKRITL